MTRAAFLIGFAVLPYALSAALHAATPSQQVGVRYFKLRPIASVNGKDSYAEYCARCHGDTGRGDGPEAPRLRVPAADLTTIAQRHGQFEPGGILDRINSFQRVPRTVAAYQRRARAEREGEHVENASVMPVWGPLFAKLYTDRSERSMRLTNLVNYLGSIQASQ